ncbi:hypothetical protein C0J45_2177 [Silurus meridionalis]|nr:hypothetical protein C0J45_2177 [Silurus meridionalis]
MCSDDHHQDPDTGSGITHLSVLMEASHRVSSDANTPGMSRESVGSFRSTHLLWWISSCSDAEVCSEVENRCEAYLIYSMGSSAI